jgi:hypothetical protein
VGILVRIHRIRVQDTRQLDLGLDGAVLVEHPLADIFIVGGSEDLLNNELPGARDNDRIVSEVSVLE